MRSDFLGNPRWSRRDLLKGAGAAGMALMAAPLLDACGATGGGGGSKLANGAHDVSGKFSWTKAKGATIKLLQTPHRSQQAYAPMLREFTALTGIKVEVTLVDEADYFTKLNTELAAETGEHDVFMTGAYFIWTYGPPGWMENLKPWLDNPAATSPSYDFDDIYEFLRKDTCWDFVNGHPVGSGGQYAIPWNWETNVITYNRSLFKKKGIKPPETFDDLMDVAVSLTNRGAGIYGLSYRGSKSWATMHPGYMTGFTRQGAKDFTAQGTKLTAAMNSSVGTSFTEYWAELAKKAGPSAWSTYVYQDCERDLGNGVAAMVWDADGTSFQINMPGGSKEAGNLAWYPGPKGPEGLGTNIWTWSLAMNSASKNKLAAWLFIQWATGKESMTKAATNAAFADPVRASVFNDAFKKRLSAFPGYLETMEAVLPQADIYFTPQQQYFNTTQDWAVALENIYDGSSGPAQMNSLASTVTALVNKKS